MNRRSLLIRAGAMAVLPLLGPSCSPSGRSVGTPGGPPFRRARPSDPTWPDAASWERLNR